MESLMSEFLGAGNNVVFHEGDMLYSNAFGNVGVVDTGEGLVMIDTGLTMSAEKIFKSVRAFSPAPVKVVIYTHGHLDHCYGFKYFLGEIEREGWEKPIVIANENLPNRLEKYRMLEAYHAWINKMQFASALDSRKKDVIDADEVLAPTVLVKQDETHQFKMGKYTFDLYPEMGETDDALWVHVPEAEVLFTGDLIVSSFPNVGNPFKVQRYPRGWADAMRHMLGKRARYLVPGHGPFLEGPAAIKQCLQDNADAMLFIHENVVRLLNEGKWFDEVYREMLAIMPERFKTSPYLLPVYGDYRFAIHCEYRLYHGWYDSGNPTDLFPAPPATVNQDLLEAMADGDVDAAARKIMEKAEELLQSGEPQRALHVIDVLARADPGKAGNARQDALKLKIKALRAVAKHEESFIARNILNNGLKELKLELKELKVAHGS